jgi:hypothetical protein
VHPNSALCGSAERSKDHEVIATGVGLQRAFACSRAGTFSTKRPKSGQAKSGDDSGTVIDPERLALARALYQLTLALDPTLDFRFSIAILSEKLADYALAIQQAGNADVTATPLQFDLIVCSYVLSMTGDQMAPLLARLHPCLTPTERIAIVDFDQTRWSWFAR